MACEKSSAVQETEEEKMIFQFNIYGDGGKASLLTAIGESANGDKIVLECSNEKIKAAADVLATLVRQQLSELGKGVEVETVLLTVEEIK